MTKSLPTLVALFVLCTGLSAQSLTDLFVGVDTLFMAGAAPGSLESSDTNVTPIVSLGPCNTPIRHYAVAARYQGGRAIAIAHESLLSDGNINRYDNLRFVTNSIAWLNPGGTRVSLKTGWVNNGNTQTLQASLTANAYTFSTLSGPISAVSLANTDVLILGNDWNNRQAYAAAELSALDAFVANGGSVFIAGLGWSWPQALNTYPMNQTANLFGFSFTNNVVRDPGANVNGAPKFYHFYPANLDTSLSPHCPSPFVGTNIARGDTMRVLRLAVSSTGEFTQQSGGVAATATAITQWLDQINAIYGREYCVRFELIPNNNLLLFPDPGTDPWGTLPPGSGGCTNASIILSRQAAVIDSVIGAANYDISHVIAGSPFGGGCAGSLKRGVSGGLNIPVTRHEIGHQLAQSHTINHPNNDNYEPENGGWTIQGGNQRGYAHAVSYHQTAEFLRDRVPEVGAKIPTGNAIPSVDAGPDVAIPVLTPFALSATANDPDPNTNLTYVWDNMTRGLPQRIPVNDDAQGALFMRLIPDTRPSRTFPQMSDVVANNDANAQEQLPSQARIMDIRVTVNDNHQMLYQGKMVNASATHSDDIQVTVAEAGPFVVTSQNAPGIAYRGGSDQIVSWAVNGTDTFPINTREVRISLSTDGGYTYPTVLSPGTANNGSATITLPNISTSSARIKVEAVGNIYFDINTQNFAVERDTTTSITTPTAFPVSIWPNPADALLKIEVPAPRPYRVQLFDAQGRLAFAQADATLIDVAELRAGIYLVVVTDLHTGEAVARRVVVE